MRKIGILTSVYGMKGAFGCNYGAVLQGYALVNQLRQWGYDAYDIYYLSDNEYSPVKYGKIERTFRRLGMLLNPSIVKSKYRQIRNHKNVDLNRGKFVDFIQKNDLLYKDGKTFRIDELRKEADDFHAFITGSDVVWNPFLRNNVNDEGYFLDFVPESVKKIAYAPSFGVTELPETSRVNLKALLSKFDALSVREKSGAKLVGDVTGLKIPVVLDPTLLLNPVEYRKIEKQPTTIPEKYIAVYRFGDISHTKEKIKEISQRTGLAIVNIPATNDPKYSARYDFGPGEFIWAIRNASLVISDSFHCSVFAMICHTPFLTFCRNKPNAKGNLNSRMIDLLKMTRLDSRMVIPGEAIDYDSLFSVDFEAADAIIAELRTESQAYLRNALER